MRRREFISKSTTGVGLLIGGSILLPFGCNNSSKPFNELFTQKEVDLLNQMADIIFPETDSPGGKAAKVGEFIASVVKDCSNEEQQMKLKNGLKLVDDQSRSAYSKDYLDCSLEQQDAITRKLDQEEKEFFPEIKQWIVSGYLTSEIGATKFLKYPQVPGYYDGCTSERPW